MMQKELFEALSQAFPGVKLVEAEPLKHRTSFRIGGPAPMAFPRSAAELAEMYRFLLARGCRALILGAGSNVLAPDAGLSRLILCTREMADLSLTAPGRITAECGVLLSRLASFARDRGLAGLEFAHGIPGTVGGGIYMNAGAYGGELKDVAVATEALLPDGTLWRAEGAAQEFSYRDSAFQRRGAVILKTEFALEPGDPAAITAKMQELAQRRRASQPLDLPSAGSTFKRPQGAFAGRLIEECGLRGFSVGGAQISEKHCGFVINKGGATCADVVALTDRVREIVQERTGYVLEREIRVVK